MKDGQELFQHIWFLQVQAENVQQAESLVRLTEKVESLNGDLEDTQQLIGALHGASLLQHLLGAMLRPGVCKARSDHTIAAMYIHGHQSLFTKAWKASCHAGATAKQLQLVMQALTLSQAAKALAQSVSSQLAAQSGAAGSNGVPRVQVGCLLALQTILHTVLIWCIGCLGCRALISTCPSPLQA